LLSKNKQIAALILVLTLFAAVIITGCLPDAHRTHTQLESITTFRDIPGITANEIKDIEELLAGRDSFSYAMLLSSEVFPESDGSLEGFAVLFCDLLTGLFGIPFVLEVLDWNTLKPGLDEMRIDFSGDLTPTPERREQYYMTLPIADRSLSIVTSRAHFNFEQESDISRRTLGFYEGTITAQSIKDIFAELRFTGVYDIQNAEDAAQRLLRGEIDAFILDTPLVIEFEKYNLHTQEFTSMIFVPVSMATANPELQPIIAAVDAYIRAGGAERFDELYGMGYLSFSRYSFKNSLTEEEAAYIRHLDSTGGKVPIAYKHDNYPVSFYNDKDGEFQGIALDILKEITDITGIEFEPVTNQDTHWLTALDMLSDGCAAIVTELIYSESRSDSFLWSEPYAGTSYALISRADDPVLKLPQVARKTVGINRLSIYEELYGRWFPDDSNVIYYDTQYECFAALENKEVDLLMGSVNDLLMLAHFRESPGFRVNILFNAPMRMSSFGFNKNEEILRSIVNKAQNLINTRAIELNWTNRVFDYARVEAEGRVRIMTAFTAALFAALALLAILFRKNLSINKAYQSQSATLNAVFQSIPDLIFCKDRNGAFLSANRSFFEHHGRSPEELIGKTDLEAFDTDRDVLKAYMEIDQKVMNENITLNFQEYAHTDTGPGMHVESIKTPLIQGGETIGMLGIIRDISKIKEAEEAAREASRTKSDFLARMSHEIRTPMNAIMGMAELALREEMSSAAREHTVTIRQSGSNLLAIINDILDLSKVETGKMVIIDSDYSLSSLINDVVGIVRTKIFDSSLRFIVNVNNSMPDALRGDEIRIRQIMLNLLSNAVKYTDKGFVSFSVDGRVIDGEKIILTVEIEDSGKGIKEQDMDKLFDEFTQLDVEDNMGIEGAGLGLSIALSLAQAMEGDINVRSEYGKGSTFTVTLPQKYRRPDKIAYVPNAHMKKILIYERREVCVDSIMRTMENLGLDATLVSTVQEFVTDLTGRDYDFVFIAAALYKNVKEEHPELETNARIILVAEFGEPVADTNLDILNTPIYSVSVANIINGVSGSFGPRTDNGLIALRCFVSPQSRVLIVDDIPANLKVAEGLMLPYGMRIDLCKSGAAAVEAVKSNRYDIVFMDHKMPGMDGMEAARRIRALEGSPYFQSVPVIALTANAVIGAADMFMENGFNGYLSKPIEVIRLHDILERFIPKEKRQNSR